MALLIPNKVVGVPTPSYSFHLRHSSSVTPFFVLFWREEIIEWIEGTGTRPDYLVNRADKKIEGPFGERICTQIKK